MTEHMKLNDMPKFCAEIEKWLKARYGKAEGTKLWEATSRQYHKYLEELPDYGGKKASHALAIYGSIIIFSMYPLLPDHPPVEELQEFVTSLFMSGFARLGKIFNLNRNFDMWLINKVFQQIGEKDRKQYAQHPACFCNISEPYDKKNHAARYHFTQCPNAEFAKKHNLMHILPLFCNSDYWGIRQIHGTLIRLGTCGNSDKCDYCVVGSENPMAKEYEIVKDENGFLVNRKIKGHERKKERTELFSMHVDKERGDIGRFMDAESSDAEPWEPEPLGFDLAKDLVPVGTVVATDRTLNLKIIIGYHYKNPDNDQVYDYIACKYPNDNGKDCHKFYFNRDEIDRYYRFGYPKDEPH